MKRFSYMLLLMAVLFCAGCTEEVTVGTFVEKEVVLSLSAAPVNRASAGTRADVAEGLPISDFWIFQYDSNDALIGRPVYYRTNGSDSQPVSLLLPSETGIEYKAVFIANTHDNGLDIKIGHSSLSALASSCVIVESSSDTWQKGYDDLMMSGVVTIDSQTRQIECPLYRNVAKLSLTVNNEASSGITINSVQLRNVSNTLYYADCLNSGKAAFPNTSEVTFIDFEKEELEVRPQATASLKYYLPRNMRGSASAGSEYEKNDAAPVYSTYIEVMATHNERNTPVRYRFYLGKNNADNFDVEPNYLYEVSLRFNGSGTGEDGRVEDLGVVQLADANSYIIQPIKGVGVKYTVPVKDRINKFWQSEQGQMSDGRSRYVLDGTNEWVAEVIWQDVAGKQVVKFCLDDGTLADEYRGGTDGDSFSFVPTEDAVGTPCNVLIGVRNASDDWERGSDGYMWSWHIWLTEYSPDTQVGGWVEGKYSYQVPGGALHKYVSFENIPMYDGKFIMDRNLGALRADSYGGITDQELRAAAGMYYAYGRKDPFPGRQLYDVHGNKLTFSDGTNAVDNYGITLQPGPAVIYASVIKPYNFYWRNEEFSGNDWVVNNQLVSYDWNDLNKTASGGQTKSFFDPCPPGWKVPDQRVFDGLGTEKYVYASNCVDWVDLTKNLDFKNYKGWLVYLSGQEGWDNKSGDVAFFPAAHNRSYNAGVVPNSLGGHGELWTANARENGTAEYLYFANEAKLLFSHPRGYYRYLGMPVRCIQE